MGVIRLPRSSNSLPLSSACEVLRVAIILRCCVVSLACTTSNGSVTATLTAAERGDRVGHDTHFLRTPTAPA